MKEVVAKAYLLTKPREASTVEGMCFLIAIWLCDDKIECLFCFHYFKIRLFSELNQLIFHVSHLSISDPIFSIESEAVCLKMSPV